MSVTAGSDHLEAAESRLQDAIPAANDIRFQNPERGRLLVTFNLNSKPHAFALRRAAGIWQVRDWVLDGKHQDTIKLDSGPRFENVIRAALGALVAPPRIQIKELRCPEKTRLLFAKLIVQGEPDSSSTSSLVEFSCPFCKRITGKITFHLFDDQGKLVKTETTTPYIKGEPGPWYSNPEAPEPSSRNHKAPKEVAH